MEGPTKLQLRLSAELAKACGLTPRRPAVPDGILRDVNDNILFQWFKCAIHDTWLQPEWQPFPHWKCAVTGCDYVRAAKMRTDIERKLFRILRRTEELG